MVQDTEKKTWTFYRSGLDFLENFNASAYMPTRKSGEKAAVTVTHSVSRERDLSTNNQTPLKVLAHVLEYFTTVPCLPAPARPIKK